MSVKQGQCEAYSSTTGKRCRRLAKKKVRGHWLCMIHVKQGKRTLFEPPERKQRSAHMFQSIKQPNLDRPKIVYKPVPPGQKRRGRKPIPVDWKKAEKMFEEHATVQEVADYFGLTITALTRRNEFVECYKRAYAKGKLSLRRLQWALANRGDRTMLIWLGKQYLGQSDQLDQRLSGPDGGPVRVQTANLSVLSTTELETLSRLLEKASAPDDGSS